MAEQNLEITYIPYGLDEISQQDLMTNLANGVSGYLDSKRWARKDKYRLAWLNAYQNIINAGLTGASNESGIWTVNHKGEAFPLENMSNIDREMYLDAAWYIQLQMSKMTPRKKEEEETKKEDLEKYGNFGTNLMNQMLKGYGNNAELFKDSEQGWDAQDARGANGLRGTTNRRAAMIKALSDYRDSLNDKDFDFEGTSFKDKADLQTKIQAAIDALGTNEETDDLPAFNALGIPYRAFFSNGGNDATTHLDSNGNPYTYNQWNEYQQELNKLKAELQQQIAKLKLQAAYNNTLFLNRVTSPKMQGLNSMALKEKYKDSNSLLKALQGYALKDIRTLTPDELSEVHGAYRNLATQPIDNNLLNQIKKSSSGLYKNAAPNRFRKINGIDNLIWDSVAGQVIQINTRLQLQAILNQPLDLFAGVKTLLDIQNDYMNSTEGGFTPAELREVAALLFDLGAAVDPEGFSSAGLSQIAAGIRDYNRGSDPEGWTWRDTGWAALDHGLGLLSAIPVVGGLVKGSWAAAKLGNYIPKMEKWIRLAGRAGSTYAMAANAPGALNTLNKIKNGEDLSLKDYLDLAYFFIGGLGHHQLNRGNRVERSAMKARGVETSNSVLNKAGITRTKAKTTNSSETTPTLKVLKTGEDGKVETKEIPITKEQEAALKKAKPGKLNEVATEAKINNIPEGYKIVEPTINSNWRSKINTAKSWFGKGNSEIFGTPTTTTRNSSALKSDEEFELYLSKHNNTLLKKVFNGSNRDIRRYDKYLGNNNQVSSNKSSEESSPKTVETSKPKSIEISKQSRERIKKYNESVDKRMKNLDEGKFSKNKLKSGDLDISGHRLQVVEQSDGTFNLIYKGNILENFQKHELKKLQEAIREIIKNRTIRIDPDTKAKTIGTKEIGKILLDLKKKGWLKQGGTINPSLDTIIEDFIKNNNI